MSTTHHVLAVHPAAPETAPDHRVARAECIDACLDCAQACTSGADAWLDEPGETDMRALQRAQQNCAAICVATASILPRLGSPGTDSGKAFLETLLQACRSACTACLEQSKPHLSYPHSRLSHEACARCGQTCTALLATMELTRP
ncbi:four-helix bundle copper-binding protein [Arthrobacter crystallopoietes]|jgi:hypothetical protein|uniref:four-helix bundle copper-binding protein n=1 Tax=Crystallibacter crystallopoietes TaxID=37928 RepID=UPI001111269C|nr:four-helix bundle copper-binding protein [Arthrobacter crystallopoietes]QTG80471.1 four-helix bundle copper-binding protein [Arthrobacter crystallopoietes]